MAVHIILSIAFLGAIFVGITTCRHLLKKSMEEDEPKEE